MIQDPLLFNYKSVNFFNWDDQSAMKLMVTSDWFCFFMSESYEYKHKWGHWEKKSLDILGDSFKNKKDKKCNAKLSFFKLHNIDLNDKTDKHTFWFEKNCKNNKDTISCNFLDLNIVYDREECQWFDKDNKKIHKDIEYIINETISYVPYEIVLEKNKKLKMK